MTEPITEDWLKAAGFKWHEFERQGAKHWLLWLGEALPARDQDATFANSYDDLGIELSRGRRDEAWFCWLRADYAGRYTRFLHIRYLSTAAELVTLIEALIGAPFDPANAMYGILRWPERAARLRAEDERLDRRLMRSHSHNDVEKDDTMGRPLPEHRVAYEEGRKP